MSTYRELVAGLAGIPPVRVGAEEYAGSYLALLVAVNPALGQDESARTPQLIAETGQILALARRDAELSEVRYRRWREQQVSKLATDLAFVQAHVDVSAAKPLSRSAAGDAVHLLPDYEAQHQIVAEARRAVTAWEGVMAAAQARTRVIWSYEGTGGGARPTRTAHQHPAEPVAEYTAAAADLESAAMSGARTPIPMPSGPVPPPPGRRAKAPPPAPSKE